MAFTVAQVAEWVGGDVLGAGERELHDASALTKATYRDITFAATEQHWKHLPRSSAGAVLIPRAQLPALSVAGCVCALIGVDDPQGAFIEILQRLRPAAETPVAVVSPLASIAASAQIAAGCHIYPGAYIGERVQIGAGCVIHPGVVISDDCTVGENCTLYPHAVLYPRVTVGQRVILHAGCVLGADGFGYRFVEGRFVKVPQLGSVTIEDDVEIGACATVDRGAIGPTVIGEGTKLDNLVMIGHNCELGKHNAFASQVGLAGSVTTGDYVRCGGQVGIADHVHLGTGSVFGAKSGIHKSMEAGQTYLGSPATTEMEQIKMQMALRKLPILLKQIRELEQQVAELQRRLPQADPTHRAA